MKIYQHATMSEDPSDVLDIATKQYVDNLISAVSGGAGGSVFFTNIQPTSTGNVGDKQYVANTVPSNKVITDGTTDTDNVRVSLVAEGSGSFYSPTITITTDPVLPGTPMVVPLSEDANDKRMFSGFVDLTAVSVDVEVTATSSTSKTATCIIHRAAAGPQIDTLLIGTLPNSQTEAKAGDVVPVSGRIQNAAAYVEIIAGGASSAISSMTLGSNDSFGSGFKSFSGTFIVGGGTGLQNVSARGRNSLGTYGNTFQSTNQITLNQTYPTIGARTITYPAGQTAIKGSEAASVSSTITNADTVLYTSSANLSVDTPSTYAVSKTVTRVSGTYVTGQNNYTITATKTSNNAISTANAQIVIADAAPTASISIGGNPTRLLSSPTGVNYTVTITPSQVLSSAPSLVASSGVWQGSWTQSGNNWTRVLKIFDGDLKGPQTFSSLSLTNQALVNGSTITAGSTYTVGGFATRTITFAAFERYHAIGTLIGDITKVTSSYTGGSTLTRFADTANHFQGFTIVDASGNYDPNGGYLYISDAAFANSNTSGTLQLDIAEAA